MTHVASAYKRVQEPTRPHIPNFERAINLPPSTHARTHARTMNGNSKLAGAAAASSRAQYEHKPLSYRRVLSDEGLADIEIEVTSNPKKGGEGNQPDVLVEVYSKSYFQRTGKKTDPKLYTPEMMLAWADVHTIGSDYQNGSKDLRQRKNKVILQTKFLEAIMPDTTLKPYDQVMNEKMNNFAEHRRSYTDINEEVRWFRERLELLRRMICRKIWEHKDTLVGKDAETNIRNKIIMSARQTVAQKRGVQAYEVKPEDPEVGDCAFEMFLQQPYIAKVIGVDSRSSEPDTCPAGADCMGVACTHAEHKFGKQEHVIMATRRVFSMRNYDKAKHDGCKGLMSKAIEAEWDAANPEAAMQLGMEDLQRARDQYAVERMNGIGYIYTPVFYRTQKTINILKDDALKTLGPKQGLHREMHNQVLRRGNVVRLGLRISGMAFPTKGAMGMFITFDSTEIVVVAQPKVPTSFDGADELMTWDEVDLEGGSSMADVDSVDILGNPDDTMPGIDVSGGNTKRGNDSSHFDQPDAKRTKYDLANDMDTSSQ